MNLKTIKTDLGLFVLRDWSACLDWALTGSAACQRLDSEKKGSEETKHERRRDDKKEEKGEQKA